MRTCYLHPLGSVYIFNMTKYFFHMKGLYFILVAPLFFFSGCCFIDPEVLENGCVDQIFEERKNVPIESVYTLNTTANFRVAELPWERQTRRRWHWSGRCSGRLDRVLRADSELRRL